MSRQTTLEHYDEYAQNYDQNWQGYLNHTHNRMLETILPELEEGDRILDASCGTGLLAEQLIQNQAPFRELVLNDISPRMLGVAQNRLPDDPRITYNAYPSEDLQFEGNRFTRVICLNALHNYDNPSLAIRRFKQSLTPEGRLYLLDWNRAGWFKLINSLINRLGSETINTMSLKEVNRLLEEHQFTIHSADQWNYRYWQLFLVIGGFQPWRD